MQHNILQTLGLDLASTAGLKIDNEIVAGINAALTEAEFELAGKEHLQRQVLIEAARSLFNAGQLREVVVLCAAANDNHLALVNLHIQSLEKLGATDDIIQLIERIESVKNLPNNLRIYLTSQRQKMSLRLSPENYKCLWGAIPNSISDILANIPTERAEKIYSEHNIDVLLAVRQGCGDNREDFLRRLVWGQAAHEYNNFLRTYKQLATGDGQGDAGLSTDDKAIFSLFEQFNDLLLPFDKRPLEDAQNAGQSILIARAHAGPFLPIRSKLLGINLPFVIINHNKINNVDDFGNIWLGTNSEKGDFQIDFLKIAKQMHKKQRIIYIYPDGGRGGSCLNFELLGRTFSLGQGGATLAYLARAATFFCGMRWENGRIQIYLRTGPVADEGMDRREFDQAFYAFYLDCLREIVHGNAENMVGSMIWQILREPTPSGKE